MTVVHFLIVLSALHFSPIAHGATVLKINGSTTVSPVVVDTANAFKEKGWKVFVDTQGGSSGGISYLAENMVDIGMSSRPIDADDRKKFPKANFKSHIIGYDGVALVVSKSLYDKGIKSLTKAQIKKIYEGKTKNWQEVGGPNQRIVFFNKEPGRGTWEVFANFLYGSSKKTPKVFHPEVGANQEARTKVAMHPGAITQLSASWAWNHDKVKTIAITEGGTTTDATLANIKNNTYPMKRPLLLITNGEKRGAAEKFIDYIQSPEGQKIVEKHGYLSAHPTSGS